MMTPPLYLSLVLHQPVELTSKSRQNLDFNPVRRVFILLNPVFNRTNAHFS